MTYKLPRSSGNKGAYVDLSVIGTMVEARSLHILVSSYHPSADQQVAEAIARVISRYAVDVTPEIEVKVPHAGIYVPYVAKAAMRFSSRLRAWPDAWTPG